MKNFKPAFFTILTALSCEAATTGYPRLMLFRENFPDLLPYYSPVRMMVSDLHTDKRKFSDEQFKADHPDSTVLIQINNEPTGVWGTWEMLPKQRMEDLGWLVPEIRDTNRLLDLLKHGVHPMMDFPGHWVYEAGSTVLAAIPDSEQTVTFKVSDITPFRPVAHRLSLRLAKQHPDIKTALLKDLVIYSKLPDGSPDWLNADMGSITAIDEKEKSVTVRRWKTEKPWSAFPAGAYAAPSAVPVTYSNEGTVRQFPEHLRAQMTEATILKPFLPNLTKNCPVDPRSGLTAVETMAKHYIDIKNRLYPNADGFVFDVSCGTFWPSHRVSDRIDSANDGKIDNFHFDGVLIWPLGIYDFCLLLREGKPGAFDGLGEDLILVSDSNFNEDQRYFDVMNGGEYEHSFTLFFPPYNFMYSSNLDRFFLWDRIGRRPDRTFIHNKYADEAHHGGKREDLNRPATLAHYRLDMATACMGSGYVGKTVLRASHGGNAEEVNYPGKREEIRKYGFTRPVFYDEYHAAREEFGWLGLPSGDAFRIRDGWSEPLYTFDQNTKLPKILTLKKPWKIREPVRMENGFAFEVTQVGLWRELKDSFQATVALPLPGVVFEKDGEYTVTFRLKGSSVYEAYGPRYRNIPKSLRLRLSFDQAARAGKEASLDHLDTNVAALLGGGQSGGGYMQELLVFPDEREITVTLIAAADGPGFLEFDATDEKGTYEISGLQIRKGCADVLVREFENGLVLANGSCFSAAGIDVQALFPNAQFKRIKGTQDPVHNNGEPAERISLQPGDGIFLERIK